MLPTCSASFGVDGPARRPAGRLATHPSSSYASSATSSLSRSRSAFEATYGLSWLAVLLVAGEQEPVVVVDHVKVTHLVQAQGPQPSGAASSLIAGPPVSVEVVGGHMPP